MHCGCHRKQKRAERFGNTAPSKATAAAAPAITDPVLLAKLEQRALRFAAH